MKETYGIGDAWITKEPSGPIFLKVYNSILRVDTLDLVYIVRHLPSKACSVQVVYGGDTFQIYPECTEEQAEFVVDEIMEAIRTANKSLSAVQPQ